MRKLGLGDFWNALHSAPEIVIPAFMDRLHEYEVVGQAETVTEVKTVDAVVAMILQTPLIDAIAWIGMSHDRKNQLISLYPSILKGCGIVDARLVSFEPWEGCIEGQVRVSVHGQEFDFFDSLFPTSSGRYVPGEKFSLALCGLSISVHRLSAIAELASGKPEVTESINHVYQTGTTGFMQSYADGNPDDLHLITGKLTKVQSGAFGPIQLFRCEIKLFPDVPVPVVFGATSIHDKSWTPVAGDYVAMMVFLHGHRVSLAPRLPDQSASSDQQHDG